MSFWIRNEAGEREGDVEGEVWARKGEGRGGGGLETLCFYPTVKLFVLNEAKKTPNGFPRGDRSMFMCGEREGASEHDYAQEGLRLCSG